MLILIYDAGGMDSKAYYVFWAALCMCGLVSLSYWAMFSPRSDCSMTRWMVAIVLSSLITIRGMKRNSLDFSGGMLSAVIGLLVSITSAAFVVSMIAFFMSSSTLTKWQSQKKKEVEVDFKEGQYAAMC